jgi:hypothetical protein
MSWSREDMPSRGSVFICLPLLKNDPLPVCSSIALARPHVNDIAGIAVQCTTQELKVQYLENRLSVKEAFLALSKIQAY